MAKCLSVTDGDALAAWIGAAFDAGRRDLDAVKAGILIVDLCLVAEGLQIFRHSGSPGSGFQIVGAEAVDEMRQL